MNKQKVKEFIKAHKKEIILGTVAIAGTGALCAIGVKIGKKNSNRVWMPGFTIDEPLMIKDLGKLGEEYLKHDSELTEDTLVLEVGKFRFE